MFNNMKLVRREVTQTGVNIHMVGYFGDVFGDRTIVSITLKDGWTPADVADELSRVAKLIRERIAKEWLTDVGGE